MREDIALFASWAVAIVFLLAAFWALGKYEKERDRRRELQSRMHMITKRQYQVRGPGGVVVWTSEEKGGQS